MVRSRLRLQLGRKRRAPAPQPWCARAHVGLCTYVSGRHGWVGGEAWYGLVEVVEVHLHRGGQEGGGGQVQATRNKVEHNLNNQLFAITKNTVQMDFLQAWAMLFSRFQRDYMSLDFTNYLKV